MVLTTVDGNNLWWNAALQKNLRSSVTEHNVFCTEVGSSFAVISTTEFFFYETLQMFQAQTSLLY